MQKYIELLYKLSKKAYKLGEVPVAAVLVKNNKIVSSSYNKRAKHNNLLGHAEIQCLIKASKKLKDWRFNGCDLYVTLEPCHMCREIINEARIDNVYYLMNNNKHINYNTRYNFLSCNCDNKKFKELLTSFFKNKR